MAELRCIVCGSSRVRARDRCATCYAYRRRTGTDRTEGVRIKRNVAELERSERDEAIADVYREAGGYRPRR